MTATAINVCGIIAEEIGLSFMSDHVTPASTFEELKMDSLDLISALAKIEETMECEIPPEALEHFRTVGDVIAWLEHGT